MVTSHTKRSASTQLAKDLKITQKSTWFVLHRLRHAARTQSFAKPFEGMVRADETCIGGREKNKHTDKKTPGSQEGAKKVAAMGIMERDCEFRHNCRVINEANRANALLGQVEGRLTYNIRFSYG